MTVGELEQLSLELALETTLICKGLSERNLRQGVNELLDTYLAYFERVQSQIVTWPTDDEIKNHWGSGSGVTDILEWLRENVKLTPTEQIVPLGKGNWETE